MMKFLMLMIFTIPLCFMNNIFWMVQLLLLILFFFFLNLSLSINFFSNLSFNLGCDIISYGLIMLSIWICMLMIMASENLFKLNFYVNFFMFNILFLLIMLYLTFSTLNLFLFYLFFEGSLIPCLMLIIGWGNQIERVQSGLYLLFYTLFSSFPMLLGIFFLFFDINTLMLYFMKFFNMNMLILYIVMVLSFLVKMPMYFVHLWLPKAHVEASISGSMILAGIMLKLGGYGLIRLLILFYDIGFKFNFIILTISLIGGFYVSLICFSQIDIKSLIAYSSVCHMSLVLGGIMTMNYWGYLGSYCFMIGHGLCSSGMFCLINLNYERLHSRSMFINKGMLSFMPVMSLWWFLLISSNMSAPPSLNLLGEISLLNSLMSWSYYLIIMLMLIMFFSAGYSIYLYSYTQHGKNFNGVYSFHSGVSREYLLLLLHWLPLNFLVLKVDYSIILIN